MVRLGELNGSERVMNFEESMDNQPSSTSQIELNVANQNHPSPNDPIPNLHEIQSIPRSHSSNSNSNSNSDNEFEDSENKAMIYKVKVPQPYSFKDEIFELGKRTFFPEDPFKNLKGFSGRRKLWRMLCMFFPILDWGRHYELSHLKGDVIAGLTIASIAIPQDLGYAGLAHLSPIHGLYSSFVPPLIYAAMGTSKHIAIGPVAVASLLLGHILSAEVDPVKEASLYLRLALTSTLLAGLVQAGLGFLRLGVLIDFLSEATIVGFMGGAAIVIALQQLKGLFNIKNFTKSSDIVSVLKSVVSNIHHSNWRTIVIGFLFLFLLTTLRILAKKNPSRYRYFYALGPLTSLILTTLFIFITKANKNGVSVVGHIEKGINPTSISSLTFSTNHMGVVWKAGLVTGLVGLSEGIAIGRSFASRRGYRINGNSEMLAMGFMNIFGSFTSCYVTTGSFSRSAVNYSSGATSALSNIIMAFVILLVILFLTPLFYYTPACILSAIIINAVLSIIDFNAFALIWKTDKLDFLSTMAAFLGTLFVSVEIGLLLSVSLSLLRVLLNISRPSMPVLGQLPGTSIYRSITQYPEAVTEPGILILRINSNVYFANSSYVCFRILQCVEKSKKILILNEKEDYSSHAKGLKFIVLEMTPVLDIDTSAIKALKDLYLTLNFQNLQLVLANPGDRVLEKLQQSGFLRLLGDKWVFLSIVEAVNECKRLIKLGSKRNGDYLP